MVIRVKARKCEHYKLKYCLTSSLGILSYAEGSKTTDCQDTVLILGKRMRDSLDMGKHHVKNWPPHPKIDPLIPSGQTPKMISTYQYRRKSLWIHWSSSHPLELKSRRRRADQRVRQCFRVSGKERNLNFRSVPISTRRIQNTVRASQ